MLLREAAYIPVCDPLQAMALLLPSDTTTILPSTTAAGGVGVGVGDGDGVGVEVGEGLGAGANADGAATTEELSPPQDASVNVEASKNA